MRKEELHGSNIFVLHDFLPAAECRRLIAWSEELGYSDAPITTAAGFLMRKDVRDNERVMVEDPAFADALWRLARPQLPEEWFGWKVVGFNERLRFYRYDAGQKFAPHTDGYFQRPNGERSHLTFMVYLNDGFRGGATAFHHKHPSLEVGPQCGKALVFYHRQLHEGAPVLEGRKYVLRTDVMYRRGEVRAKR
jgi:predicted 2-oxoglutarate/Fe(II)-dependent dioxygenase YbiX